MREKHSFKFATMLIAMLMGLAPFWSCSKDDGDGNGGSSAGDLQKYVGTWEIVHSKGYRAEDGEITKQWDEDVSDEHNRIVFSADGTWAFHEYSKSKGTWHVDGTGTYYLRDGQLMVTGDIENFKLISFSANQMVIEYEFNEQKGNLYVNKHYRDTLKRISNSTSDIDDSDDDSPSGGGESYSFQDGDIIPNKVMEAPWQYGFRNDTVLVVYRYIYGSGSYTYTYVDFAWADEGGCFITGSQKWNNKYIRFYTESNYIHTGDGVIVMDGTEKYAMYDDGEYDITIIPDQNAEIKDVLFFDDGTATASYQGPPYSNYGSSVDVYADDFSLEDVQVTTSTSWLSFKEITGYQKGDITSGGGTYDHSRAVIWWYTYENTTGSDRVGNIYITLKVNGETINHTIQVTQHARSSSGGGSSGGSSGGSGGGKYSNWTLTQFQNLYNQYARNAESTWNSYKLMKSGNSSYTALSSLRSTYRDIQSDMREIREAAEDAGFTLVKSQWETKALP